MYRFNRRLAKRYRWLAIPLVLLLVFACLTPFVFNKQVTVAAEGYLSISMLAPPGTIYDWIGGVPVQTDNTNYEWSGGVPFIRLEVVACSPDISNTPSSWSVNSGSPVAASSNYATGLTYFTVTNNSGGTVDIAISGTDMTGGNTWTLSDTATPGSMIYGLKAGLSGGDYTIVVKKTAPYNDLVTGLADSGTQDWGLRLWTPTEYTDGASKTGTVTITATCS